MFYPKIVSAAIFNDAMHKFEYVNQFYKINGDAVAIKINSLVLVLTGCISTSVLAGLLPTLSDPSQIMTLNATRVRRSKFPDLEWLFFPRKHGVAIESAAATALDLESAFALYFHGDQNGANGSLSSYFDALDIARLTSFIPDTNEMLGRAAAIKNLAEAPAQGLSEAWAQFNGDFDQLLTLISRQPVTSRSDIFSGFSDSLVDRFLKSEVVPERVGRGFAGAIGNRLRRHRFSDRDSVIQLIKDVIGSPNYRDFDASDSHRSETSKLLRLVMLAMAPDFKFLRGPSTRDNPLSAALTRAQNSMALVLHNLEKSHSQFFSRAALFIEDGLSMQFFEPDQRFELEALYNKTTENEKSPMGRTLSNFNPEAYFSAARGKVSRNEFSGMRDYLDEVGMVLSEIHLILSAAKSQNARHLVNPEYDSQAGGSRFLVNQGHNFTLFLETADNSITYNVNLDTASAPAASNFLEEKVFPSKVEVVTGSNSSGKTTYSKAVGQLETAALQGLPVPAQRLLISTNLRGVRVHFSENQEASVTGSGDGRWATQQKELAEITHLANAEQFLFIIDEGLDGSNILTTGIALEGVIRFLAMEPSVKTLSIVTTHRGDVISALEGIAGLRLTRAQDNYHHEPGVMAAEAYAKEALEMLTAAAHPKLETYVNIAKNRQLPECEVVLEPPPVK